MQRGIARASLAFVLLAATTPLASAQMFNAIGGNQPAKAPPKVAPPPALPGAEAHGNGAAPASRAPSDMEPNDALFDAINRGDLEGARDAINRGADLNARNVLGMTPMELSVDLGRNDISFLLLSMRDNGGTPPRTAVAAETKKPPTKSAKPSPVAKVATVPQPVPTQAPKLFAGDGGTPIPNAGFLGFDSARR